MLISPQALKLILAVSLFPCLAGIRSVDKVARYERLDAVWKENL